jgi:hypothetical protein
MSIFTAEYLDILDACGGLGYSKGSCSETPKVQNFVQSKDNGKRFAYACKKEYSLIGKTRSFNLQILGSSPGTLEYVVD